MAKTSDVNFFEQHIEKIVLGIAVVCLLFVVFKWGVSTPTRIEVEGTQVTPGQVDQELLDVSERRRSQADNAKLKELKQVPDYTSKIEKLRNSSIDPSITITALGNPQRVVEIPGEGVRQDTDGVKLAQLVKVMPVPEKIQAAGVRQLLDRVKNPDALASHGIVDYPVDELLKKWREELQSTSIGADVQAVVARVEVQRKEIFPDGTMGQPVTVKEVEIDAYEGEAELKVTVPKYYGEANREEVRDAVAELASPIMQELVLRPDYWPVWSAEENQWVSWKAMMPWAPKKETAVTPSAAKEEAEQAAKQRMLERRRELIEKRKKEAAARKARQQQNRRGRQTGGQMPGGMMGPGMDPGMMGPGMMGPEMAPKSTRNTRTRTTRKKTDRRTTKTRTQQPQMDPGMMGPGMDPGMMMPGMMPGMQPGGTTRRKVSRRPGMVAGQEQLSEEAFDTETIHLWFHDADVDVQKKYVYRARLVFINPLLTYEKDVSKETPEDAKVIEIASPWSQWSTPILIPKSTEFFVTGAHGAKKMFTCTVFAQSLGQWVQRKFKVKAGEPIGGVYRTTLINPATGQETEQDVNFSTGAVAVELDFNKKIVSATGRMKKTLELMYLDAGGNLMSQVRVMDLDRKNPTRVKYNEFRELIRAAENAADVR